MNITCSECKRDLFVVKGHTNVGGVLMNVYECCECGNLVFVQYGVGEYERKNIEMREEKPKWKQLENKTNLRLLG